MHVLSGWRGLAVVGIIVVVAWGLRFVLADFVLDRFGDVFNDRTRRWDRQPDAR